MVIGVARRRAAPRRARKPRVLPAGATVVELFREGDPNVIYKRLSARLACATWAASMGETREQAHGHQ